MPNRTLHPRPGLGVVAREQIRAVGIAIRREALLVALLLLGFTLLILAMKLRLVGDPGDEVAFDLVPDIGIPAAMLAILVPLAVWKGEEPARRTYLWSMPVERDRHQLIKSGAGWVWLMAALVVYLLWTLAMNLIVGGEIGVYDYRMFIGEGMNVRNTSPAEWLEIIIPVPTWQWLVPFTAVTTAYLIGSAIVLATNHPWIWGAGIWFAFIAFVGVVDATEWKGGRELMENVVTNESWFGLGTVLTGTVPDTEPVTRLSGRVSMWHVNRPNLGAWLTATATWMGLGGVAVWLAATRHREP